MVACVLRDRGLRDRVLRDLHRRYRLMARRPRKGEVPSASYTPMWLFLDESKGLAAHEYLRSRPATLIPLDLDTAQ
jgi:hypothetical protein